MHQNGQDKLYHFENSKVRKIRKLIARQSKLLFIKLASAEETKIPLPHRIRVARSFYKIVLHVLENRMAPVPLPHQAWPSPRGSPLPHTVPLGSVAPSPLSPSSTSLYQLKRVRPPTLGR